MSFNIELSIGEILDKLSILQIKLEKCKSFQKKSQLRIQYEKLKNYKDLDITTQSFFNQLYEINKTLWDLEDNIRLKSHKEEFDSEYIAIAENIHKNNDRRNSIKNNLNEVYKSNMLELKFYKEK